MFQRQCAQAAAEADYIRRMGELEPWIDENFVRSVWFGMGYQVNVKMIRDKFSGYVAKINGDAKVITDIT